MYRIAPEKNDITPCKLGTKEIVMRAKKVLLVILLGASMFSAGVAFGKQPHMQAALDSLQNAKSELQSAAHDKGGQRDKALDLVNQAI
jgi:hypothetical protein